MKYLPGFLLLALLGGCDETLVRVPDTAPPSVVITYPVPGNVLTAPVTILIEAADPDSIASVSLLVDGQSVGTDTAPPWRIAWDINYWASEANHSLVAKATDKSGNVGLSAMVLATIAVGDLPGPQLTAPADGAAFDTPALHLSWAAYTGAAGYDIQVDLTDLFSDPVAETHATAPALDLNLPGEGEYYWRVRAVDAAGRAAPWSAVRRLRVDIPTTPAELMNSFFSAYADRDSSRYALMLHADFAYRFTDPLAVPRTFDRADELQCAGHIFSGQAGLNALGDPYAAVSHIDITWSLFGDSWTVLTPSNPDFVDIPDAQLGIFTILLEARIGYVNWIHSTLEKVIVIPAVAGADDNPVTRWTVYSQQEMGAWPLKSAPRLWSELKQQYF